MSRPHVILMDPVGAFAQGTMIYEDQIAFMTLLSRGGATLPIHEKLVRANAAGLFHFTPLGTGVFFNANKAEQGAPMLLLARQAAPFVHWRARVSSIGPVPLSGSVRLLVNNDQPGALKGSLSPTHEPPTVNLNGVTTDDTNKGGATIGGSYRLNAGEGYVGVCLHAIATGCRVWWAAVSLSDTA